MKYSVPGGEDFELDTIVLDLNGCLSVHGEVVEGVAPRIAALKESDFKIVLFTGDIRGTAKEICDSLGIEFVITHSGAEKEAEMKKLGPNCAAVGNARIDNGTFKHARVSVLTLQAEGIHADCLGKVDIIVPSIVDALDLFLHPDSLCATLRE